MIDIHCHILPAVDDGPASFKEALDMARMAVSDGIRTIVATPHVNDERLRPETIRNLTGEMNTLLKECGIELVIFPGADINVSIEPDLFRTYTIADTAYVLIEFPHAFLPPNATQTVFRLVSKGLRPIITHPERNGSVIRDAGLVKTLVESGGLIQITAGSLTGEFGREVRACSLRILKSGLVHFLASDAHSPAWRPPVLSEGLKAAQKAIGKSRAHALVYENPETVLANGVIRI